MKKTFLILAICAVIAACNSNSGSDNNQDTTTATDQEAEVRNPEVDTSVNNIGTNRTAGNTSSSASSKGKELIEQSDCLTCHKEQEKLIGPAYADVAGKYEANDKNIDYLSQKVINGGSGVWGEVPMTPHPNISKAEATEMVKYILSLKK